MWKCINTREWNQSLTLNAVVVETQLLQVIVDERNHCELVVSKLQVQQAGQVEHGLGNSFIAQLVVVEPHKRQPCEVFEVFSIQHKERGKKPR